MKIKTKLGTDVRGRINKCELPLEKSLMPIYETITNAINAIENANASKDQGLITIKLIREPQENGIEYSKQNIIGFSITDNGIGFNEENFASFEKLDSIYNIDKGCKGVGRLSWIQAFQKNTVDSTYKDCQGKYKRILFSLRNNGEIEGEEKKPVSSITGTEVLLENFFEQYQNNCPRDINKISACIVQHFLPYFILDNIPQILVKDRDNNINLYNDIFKQLYQSITEEEINIKIIDNNYIFKLTHVKDYDSKINKPKIVYCADRRSVKSALLTEKIIHGLTNDIKDKNNISYSYICYVQSIYLNQRVNSKRTDFLIATDNEEFFDITIKDIALEIAPYIAKYLLEDLEYNIEAGKQRLYDYIINQAPEYRHLLKDENLYIESSATDKDIQQYLSEISFKKRYSAKTINSKMKAIESNPSIDAKKIEYDQLNKQYLEIVNDVGVENLTKYVIHRKVILDLYESALSKDETGDYFYEKFIHQLIMPFGNTNNMNYEVFNLWIIDEKLVFHRYLASNNCMPNSNSSKRPDILALVAQSNTDDYIVIVEFKRPGQDLKKSDIDQTLDYLKLIRHGSAKGDKGEAIHFNHRDSIPAYCYIIGDGITKDFEDDLKSDGFTVNGDKIFGYKQSPRNAYVEIFSYSRILVDAKKRNYAFEKELAL
jgi:hypothetical protein